MRLLRGVFSYTNPDTDGVACMLAYQELVAAQPNGASQLVDRPVVRAGVFGQINGETKAILDFLELEAPCDADLFVEQVDEICLVDTHHLAQLPTTVAAEKVVEIIDHHPGGDAFEGARIQNELVGAAATLIAERFATLGATPEAGLLLGAAILSNTLEFQAPSTTQRDREALRWLEGSSGFPDRLLDRMREERDRLVRGSTKEVLGRDLKVFAREDGSRVLMAQVEAPNATVLGRRPDVIEALHLIAEEHDTTLVLANLVDLSLGCSLIVCPEQSLREEAEHNLQLRFDDAGQAWTDGLMLRKTHLVPALVERREVLRAPGE